MANKSATDLAYNPEHHQRSKHIDRRHFFVREKVESFDITRAGARVPNRGEHEGRRPAEGVAP
eukprot:317022-Pleurochrysis_carterae.AAC.1